MAVAPLLLSTTQRRPIMVPHMKAWHGKAAPSPLGSRFVQVREHTLFGMRLTEVILGDATLDAELPLMVRFHGRGDRPHIPGGDHSRTEPMRLLLPWAPEKLGDGFTWFPLSITERKHPKVLGHYIREGSDRVSKVIRGFMERRPTRGRALAAGFSQGGMMTFALAIRYPEILDGAFPVAGWLPMFLVEEVHAKGRSYPPIRAMHGKGDPVVPVEPAVELVRELRALGLDATMELFDCDEHSMSDAMHTRHAEHIREILNGRPELTLELERIS